MDPKKFFAELKRRNVYKVAAGYAVVGWLAIQVAATVVPALLLPGVITSAVVFVAILGFPVALVLAWAFELTPEGIKRTGEIGPNESIPRRAGRKIAALIVIAGIAAAGLFAWQLFRARATSAAGKSIAVLPFQNFSDDKQNAYFADGVHDEILTTLAKVADLKVISRTSVMQYRDNATRKLPEIAQALQVAHVLEGSVQRVGNRVRVTAQLIDARTDAHLWAERYDRDLADVFAIQTEIARKITQQLRAVLSPTEQAALQAKPTADLAAYELYLRAKEIERAGRSTRESLTQQIALLDQAVAQDSAFVPALCLLARGHFEFFWSNYDHTPARLELGKAALERAARLRPDAGEVHLTRGIFHYWGARDYSRALEELAIARRALPNSSEIVYFSGAIARRQGRWEESTRFLEAAVTLDPRNATVLTELATTNYVALRRYDDAARVCDGVLVWKRDFASEMSRARVDRLARGDWRRMETVLAGPAAKALSPEQFAVSRLDLAFLQRDYQAAELALAATKAADFPGAGYVTPREWYAALIAEGLGEREKAQAAFMAARERAAANVAKRPDDGKALMILAEIDARLDRNKDAVRQAQRSTELLPLSEDALDGLRILSRFAGVCARAGDLGRALEILEDVVAKPSGPHYGELMLDERWDPLRKEPRFEKLLLSLAPK
ncbi:MAG TPA: FlgO family outer membrane protein [Chthoniobacterales bacterium]|nr:FlgO family outer membrane protein [Chthoniobacterales bacterium]